MAAGLPKTQYNHAARLPRTFRRPAFPPRFLGFLCLFRDSVALSLLLCPLVSGYCLWSRVECSQFHSSSRLINHGTTFHLLTTPNLRARPIVCLGDSLTHGVGASPGHDYPTLLSKTLGAKIINAGIDGDETSDALRRLDTDVLAKDPSLVVVELGANDFLDRQPLKKTFENLERIVQRIEDHGAMVVLVGLPTGPLGDALQPNYDRIIQHHQVAFIPKILEGILTNPHLKSEDHLHPNDEGYALIAERIRRVVEPMVRQDTTSGVRSLNHS